MTNPNSVLAKVPQEQFNSRYADPNNPAARGSLISFVSGGHLVPNPESRGLIGGLFNVAGQAMRGEIQGSGWNRQANGQQNYQYNNGDPQYQNQYSRHYRGRRRRERRNQNKLLKKVSPHPLSPPPPPQLGSKKLYQSHRMRSSTNTTPRMFYI